MCISPDHDLLIIMANHCVAWFAIECFGEAGHIRWRTDRTEMRRGMWIGFQSHCLLFWGVLCTPHCCPVIEETLLTGNTVGF